MFKKITKLSVISSISLITGRTLWVFDVVVVVVVVVI